MPLLAVRGNGPAGAYGFGAASGKPAAMTAIASTTLGTNTATITFSSIPSTYDDLVLIGYARSAAIATSRGCRLRFNNDTATNYSGTFLIGDGATASSSRSSTQDQIFVGNVPAASATANIFGSFRIEILDYKNTSYNKTALIRNAMDLNGSGATYLNAVLRRSTSAISRIDLYLDSASDFISGSVFALYGIKKAA